MAGWDGRKVILLAVLYLPRARRRVPRLPNQRIP